MDFVAQDPVRDRINQNDDAGFTIEAETWFNTHVRTPFEALGHTVNWVQGDKFSFTNWQGTYVVDFVRGADGPDPAFWWGADPA